MIAQDAETVTVRVPGAGVYELGSVQFGETRLAIVRGYLFGPAEGGRADAGPQLTARREREQSAWKQWVDSAVEAPPA